MRLFGRSRPIPGREHQQAGDRARDIRDWATAILAYSRYLAYHPEDWAIRVQFGHALKESGNMAEAEKAYRHAVSLAPNEPDPVLQLGYLMQITGRYEDAATQFGRGLALGSDRADEALAGLNAEIAAAQLRMPFRGHYHAATAGLPRQIWIGTQDYGFDTLDLYKLPNFRAPSRYHQQYQVVWLYEQLLSNLPDSQWPLVLDEALRLIADEGTLIVRHDQNQTFSLMRLRSFLARRPGLSVTMEPHLVEERGVVNAAYRIRRNQIAEYKDTSWSFVILAQGGRTATVIALLDQLRRLAAGLIYEVIIVGPRLKEYAGYDVFVFDKEYRQDYAQISLKKNEAARFASNANICIMHDRFLLDDNFFTGFAAFGYDFDFVAVNQRYATGEPYPFYGEQSGNPMVWSVPIHASTYQDYRPTHFVNGGFMIFKRVMFDAIGFNALLAWNEAEDVEITHAFAARHLPPRVNLLSTAITTVSTTHTAMFLRDASGVDQTGVN